MDDIVSLFVVFFVFKALGGTLKSLFHGDRRNDYMLSHSCGLIAFFDGKPKGGTFYTCRKAKSMGMDIINLYKTQV